MEWTEKTIEAYNGAEHLIGKFPFNRWTFYGNTVDFSKIFH